MMKADIKLNDGQGIKELSSGTGFLTEKVARELKKFKAEVRLL